MATFEEIFGTIRSLLHGHNVVIADALSNHIERLRAMDEQRCIDEVCPYVEAALQHRPIPRAERNFSPYDSTLWRNNLPSLFNETLYWPDEENALERYIHQTPNRTFELYILERDINHIVSLFNKPWLNQIRGLCFFKTLTMEQLAVMARQPSWPNFTQLALFGEIQLPTLRQLTTMPMCKHIQHLDLYPQFDQEDWTNAHTECLNEFEHLHTITIENGSEQEVSIHALSRHPNLANIQLLSCERLVGCESLFHTPTPHLHTLKLAECLNAKQFAQIISTIQADNLEQLSLADNTLQFDMNHALDPLLTPFIKKLQLEHNHTDTNVIDALIQSEALKTLEYIDMSRCALDTIAASRLFEHLSGTFSHLSLFDNDIQTSAIKVLAHNTTIQSLQKLYLHKNPLKNGLGAVLSEASWLHTIKTLTLSETQLNDPTIGTFLTHPGLSKLRDVTLYDNELADDFCHELTQHTPAWRNISLSLNNNHIGPNGLIMLANWPGLQHINTLHIEGNTFDMESLQALGESPYISGISYLRLGTLTPALQQVVQNATHFNARTKRDVANSTT